MSKRPTAPFSNQPDPTRLDELALLQRGCIAMVLLIAAIILCGWLIPPFGRVLPNGWALMKVNTALAVLLSASSLAFSQPKRSERLLLVSRLLALLVLVLALVELSEYWFHLSLRLDILLAPDPLSPQPGRMAPQTATIFALLGVVMVLLRARKRLSSHVADLFIFGVCLLILTVFSGYVFGAVHLFGFSMNNRTSPQTLLSLMLLTFVAFARRAEYGTFSILLGIGIGGKIARIATPFSLTIPFVLQTANLVLVKSGKLETSYATALMTSITSMLAFGGVLLLARRINDQEREIRDLSLRDGLTDLYNRRGFYLLAEQALRLAQRSAVPFSVLFIDLDNLKQINDSLGHDAGSAFLSDVADLLKATFRKTDIVGRIGGDEFVVAATAGEQEMDIAAQRLEEAAINLNAQPGRQYKVSFSLGQVTSGAGEEETLDDLLSKADKTMYSAKLRKKRELSLQYR